MKRPTTPRFFANMKGWQKLVLTLIIILIVTRIVAPDTAQWISELITKWWDRGVDAIDIGAKS